MNNTTADRWLGIILYQLSVEVKILRDKQSPDPTEEVNWAPLSEVRMAGTPNLKTQVERKARTQDSAEMEANGATSGQGVVRSIIVRRSENPWLEGRGPKMSIWTWENLLLGTGMAGTIERTWVETVLRLQRRQDLAHKTTSQERPGETNLEDTSL